MTDNIEGASPELVARLEKLAHRFLNESEGEYVGETIRKAACRIQDQADEIERLNALLNTRSTDNG